MNGNTSPIEVRPAVISDGETILSLWQTAARWLQAKGIAQWAPEYFNIGQIKEWMDSGADIFIASMNGEAVGTLLICWTDPSVWEELNSEDAGYIHRFAVSRTHTNAGIGRYLLAWAEREIKARGKKMVRLDCMADNTALNNYYQSNGYVQVGTRHWSNGWRANLYEKAITSGNEVQAISFT
ncbi:GNAT family N-acetyltransferase [Paenibacillus gorillae]|uniref:GNAT family N-acetyltransferase n=1 Tax=Paenibacillus gorillae TaxID=1243662 RepID=UPI0004BAC485|nr:GNAT family N-acetyltransferase [Paenibacillus gorillae]